MVLEKQTRLAINKLQGDDFVNFGTLQQDYVTVLE